MTVLADYMPPPWWLIPAMFWPLWGPLVVFAVVTGLVNYGKHLERRDRK